MTVCDKMKHLVCLTVLLFGSALLADNPPGESGNLGDDRITQDQIENNELTLLEIRKKGRVVFSTPFNKLDGYGDGPMNKPNTTDPGGRPTLQNNGTYLRINGLDGQTCLECHSIVSNATIPATLGVAGVGGSATNAMAGPNEIDVDDESGLGYAFYNGRFINPPFLFGSGGVELLGKEMTTELQGLKAQAQANPNTVVDLVTKGVSFGTLTYDGSDFDYSGVEGIDHDLVVRPFGRKGEFPTTRQFDIGALGFHFGMQPVEVVGEGVDDDGDGVTDEILVGELSALAIFNTTNERPVRRGGTGFSDAGFDLFKQIGCKDCHVPALRTDSTELTHSFPEVNEDPSQNVYYTVDLTDEPTGFHQVGDGVRVPLFADLKRHDMGPDLAESTGGELDAQFTTARLWGVADTAPYLHDGRAQTLTDAILMHGGEAQFASDAFAALNDNQKRKILAFLRTLRTPVDPAIDLL
jgi:hypothetical protein